MSNWGSSARFADCSLEPVELLSLQMRHTEIGPERPHCVALEVYPFRLAPTGIAKESGLLQTRDAVVMQRYKYASRTRTRTREKVVVNSELTDVATT